MTREELIGSDEWRQETNSNNSWRRARWPKSNRRRVKVEGPALRLDRQYTRIISKTLQLSGLKRKR